MFKKTFESLSSYLSSKNKNIGDNPIYNKLVSIHLTNMQQIKYSSNFLDCINDFKDERTNKKNDIITNKNCIDIFCEYLTAVSKTKEESYFVQSLKLILLFHDFFEEFGFKISFPNVSTISIINEIINENPLANI